jgi:hypothetical protein
VIDVERRSGDMKLSTRELNLIRRVFFRTTILPDPIMDTLVVYKILIHDEL